MRSARRSKDRSKDAMVLSDSTGEMADARAHMGDNAELAKREGSLEAASVMVVGPPGCCGSVSKTVRSRSRRKS